MTQDHYTAYFSAEYELRIHDHSGDEILTGALHHRRGTRPPAPIINGIPRFVPAKNYTDNFGIQWNLFRRTQLDSISGLPLTAQRFWSNTHWSSEELRGRTILEVGSGAGRFTEILLGTGARVVSFDYSNAVDANAQNNAGKGDLCLLQADMYDLPLTPASFDFVLCYGVLQHTPDPDTAYARIFAMLRPGGKISIDYYRVLPFPSPWSTPKYLWRPMTRRLRPETLLSIIKFYIPLWLPIDTAIRSLPRIGSRLAGLVPVPCWNYIDIGLTREQRREWAILDTFDALGATYDRPRTLDQVRTMVQATNAESVDIFYGSNGIVANSTRRG